MKQWFLLPFGLSFYLGMNTLLDFSSLKKYTKFILSSFYEFFFRSYCNIRELRQFKTYKRVCYLKFINDNFITVIIALV